MTILALYVQLARFFPKDLNLVLIWENHAFPADMEVYNIQEQCAPVRDVEFEHDALLTKSVFSLRKISKGVGLEVVHQVVLSEYRKGYFKFSTSGEYFAIQGVNESDVQVFQSSDPKALLECIKEQKAMMTYHH